jgi:hypothetical protein
MNVKGADMFLDPSFAAFSLVEQNPSNGDKQLDTYKIDYFNPETSKK